MSERNAIVRFAEAQLGKPYRWATAGPSTYDCSGLTSASYAKAGITISRGSQDQWQQGRKVPLPEIQPGDIVAWGAPQNCSHVGIYVGDGMVVNALNEDRGVVKTSLRGNYGVALLGAISFLPADSPIVETPAPVAESGGIWHGTWEEASFPDGYAMPERTPVPKHQGPNRHERRAQRKRLRKDHA